LVLTLTLGCLAAGTSGCTTTQDDKLNVLAASSLTGTFTELGTVFEKEHPGVDVRLSFDSSATLASQVVEGAPADVLATADEQTMHTVVAAGATAERPHVFATNHLVLVVPTGNPAHVRTLGDLARPGVSYVMCVPSAPCGHVAATVLDRANIEAPAASEETDVKAVLSKVTLGEADAGLVYATDALAAGTSVRTIQIPGSKAASTSYDVAALTDTGSSELAKEWVDLVLSDRGRRLLTDAGFGPP
jgi:molybdate transport system substrate-binding protein